MPLQLSPAHPDKAGGIGFLGIPPAPFLQVSLALSILFSSMISVKIFCMVLQLLIIAGTLGLGLLLGFMIGSRVHYTRQKNR